MAIDPSSPRAFYDLQTELANCILPLFTPPPARICRNAAGIVGWNGCCASVPATGGPGGQFVVSWQRDFYSEDGRSEANFINDDMACPVNLLVGAEFVINIMRCSKAIEQDGAAPDCAVVAAEALQARLDASAVRRGVICCLTPLLDQGLAAFQLLPTIAAGPGGGCIGSDTIVRLYLPNCLPCEV